MLFQKRFHHGLREGTITRTFRAWKGPRVKVGGVYRFSPTDAVEVDGVEQRSLGSISDAEARRAGFSDAAALIDVLRRTAPARLTSRSKVYRVLFHHVPVGPTRRPTDGFAPSADDLAAGLERMDQRSRHGPWTRQVLELIERNPRIAASRLAPSVGSETRPFKANVRKLKKLGLTVSHETGYELSPLGRACLARLRGTAPPRRRSPR